MRELLCMFLFFGAVACIVTALASIVASARETAPGTTAGDALTRGAFLGPKRFTERGRRLRRRAVWFQLTAFAIGAAFFFTCAEL
jgi:hypothetical protein